MGAVGGQVATAFSMTGAAAVTAAAVGMAGATAVTAAPTVETAADTAVTAGRPALLLAALTWSRSNF